MTPGRRQRGRKRHGAAVRAPAAFQAAAAAAVVPHRQHPVPGLGEVGEDVVLHLDAARAVSVRERGRAQGERTRVNIWRSGGRSGGRRVQVAA